jgi:hypothetical protein
VQDEDAPDLFGWGRAGRLRQQAASTKTSFASPQDFDGAMRQLIGTANEPSQTG